MFTNVLLADEINRGTPKTQSALLEAMAEGAVTVAGNRRLLEPPFFVLATQNPIEMEGTYPLPEAQPTVSSSSCRFPSPIATYSSASATRPPARPRPNRSRCSPRSGRCSTSRAVVSELHTPEPAFDFAARLVLATHPDRDEAPPVVRSAVRFGASPRAMQALVRAGRARALMTGRKHVSTEDIRTVAPLVLTHRVVLGFEAQLDRISAPDIIAAVLQHHRS